MKCRFDSYPPPIMRWIKLSANYEENQTLLEEINPQMIEITTKQIDSTIHQTELTVNSIRSFQSSPYNFVLVQTK